MIHHVVLFKLRASEGRDAAEIAQEAAERAKALRTLVPGAEGLEVQLNSAEADSTNSQLLLHGIFPDFAALERYAKHPAHLEFVGYIRQHLAENGRSCIDYNAEF
ncbi:MAG: Dabb family protein [Oscillospiraceae bacterium]|nr:Dabb family protein [Oscillospiraceae bacterium]MCR5306778.1 Dabb family protein [Oscillospiraceae bacterium]